MARTADQKALSRAQQLASNGAPREQIWNDTGWFQGVDGKWRFEIDDSVSRMTGERYGTLDEILDHPQLYDAYPKLAEVRTANEGAMQSSGGFQRARERRTGWGGGGPVVHEPARIDILGPNEGSRRKTALHEVQHGIQDTEGFAAGGNARDFIPQEVHDQLSALKAQRDELRARYRYGDRAEYRALDSQLVEKMRSILRPANENAFAHYRRLAGEVEARNVERRRNMTAAQRVRRAPWMTVLAAHWAMCSVYLQV